MDSPDLACLWKQAIDHFQNKRYAEAEALCVQLVQHAPDRPLAYAMLAQTCHAAGLTREATFNAFQASQRLMQATAGDIIEVAHVLLEVGEHHLAHAVLGLIAPEHPDNAVLLVELGRLFSSLEDQARALQCLELAREKGFDNAFVANMLGIVRSFVGQLDGAVAACEDSLAKAPCHGHAHWFAAQLGRRDGASARVARMRVVQGTADLDNDDTTYVHYALFKELDALGQTGEAWEALMAGAQARRSVTTHDIAQETAAYDGLIESTSDCFFDFCGDVPRDTTPIFVVGMPRTGTTLLERILGNHPQVRTCGELNDFRQQMQWVNNHRLTLTLEPWIGDFLARLDPTLLGQRYLAKTDWRVEGAEYFVDKHPMNFQWCGAILKALPHAKILHLRRHPMDSCFSNLKELFAQHYYPYSYALDELAAHYRNYDRLMRHWHGIAPGRILDVRYEDLAAQPDVEARRVQAYLGLPEVQGVTDILANRTITTTASMLQLRQPIHTRNVGGWKRYATGMAPVEVLLADLIAAYESEDALAIAS